MSYNPFEDIRTEIATLRDQVAVLAAKLPEPKAQVEDEILNIDEAAALTKRTRSGIYGLIHEGKIPYIKSGRRVLFKRNALLEWMGDCRKPVN